MSTFVEDYARQENISVEEARKIFNGWLNHKSNKERWIEEHELDEGEE